MKAKATRTAAADLEREILRLADEVEKRLAHARALVTDEATRAFFVDGIGRGTGLETAQRNMRRRLSRVLNAWSGLDEDDLFRRNARMYFADVVFFLGQGSRTADLQREGATYVAHSVGAHYPSVAEKLIEPQRLKLIANAIAAGGNAHRRPWKQLAAAWKGVEKDDPSTEVWRVEYVSWRREHP